MEDEASEAELRNGPFASEWMNILAHHGIDPQVAIDEIRVRIMGMHEQAQVNIRNALIMQMIGDNPYDMIVTYTPEYIIKGAEKLFAYITTGSIDNKEEAYDGKPQG